MTTKQISFFATHADMVAIASDAMALRRMDFVLAGLFEEPRVSVLADINNIAAGERYLVVDFGVALNVRSVPQRNGTYKFGVDQVANPSTVALLTGDEQAPQRLIAGQIGTATGDARSDDLYLLFTKVIKKRCQKIKSYYVGIEAASMLDRGARLSATLNSPKEYDLAR